MISDGRFSRMMRMRIINKQNQVVKTERKSGTLIDSVFFTVSSALYEHCFFFNANFSLVLCVCVCVCLFVCSGICVISPGLTTWNANASFLSQHRGGALVRRNGAFPKRSISLELTKLSHMKALATKLAVSDPKPGKSSLANVSRGLLFLSSSPSLSSRLGRCVCDSAQMLF
jgi:hypothetical protein